jgi:hypothetical protein
MRRRDLVVGAAFLCGLAIGPARAAALPKITVTKDPSCGCCGEWVKHLRAAGFPVETIDTPALNRVKTSLGIPPELFSCHTAQVGGYVIEGHVPESAIRKLLDEQPRAKGLAVPGMPVGSPGMEVEGSPPEDYTVYAFGDFGVRPYARYKGAKPI